MASSRANESAPNTGLPVGETDGLGLVAAHPSSEPHVSEPGVINPTRKSRLGANFSYNVIGALIPIVLSLVTVPLYVHQIGLARYGVVSLSWVLLGYLGFFDFGMSHASANALAKLGSDQPQQRSKVLMTTFYSNLALGLVGGAILFGAGGLVLLNLIKMPPDIAAETRAAYPWIAAMLPLGMIGSVFTGALESRERFLTVNLLGTVGSIGGQVLPLLCVVAYGPNLEHVIPVTVLARLLWVFSTAAVVVKLEWPVRPFDFDFGWLRKLFGYGSWVTISSILNPLLDTSIQLVVGSYIDATAVAKYSVPMTLASRSQVVAASLARTLFPMLSRVTEAEAITATQKSSSALAYGYGAVCGPAILFSGTFLHLWLGSKFLSESVPVAQILMFGAWANGIAFLPYNFLQAQGRPSLTAKISMVEIVPFFCVLFLLIRTMGLPGAALAWTLRVVINCLVLFVLSGCFAGGLRRILLPLILMILSEATALLLPMTALQSFIAAAVSGLFFLGLAALLDPILMNVAGKLTRRISGETRSRQRV